jgi:clan AA aspartic protease
MGYVHASISLGNPRLPDLKPIEVTAMVDTGAMTLCVPEHVALQLKLEMDSTREVTTADGKKHEVNYVGPIRIQFENRSCFVGAMVMGDEVLLGAVPLEDMDLVIHPSRRTLVVNPESPNIPSAKAKRLRAEETVRV